MSAKDGGPAFPITRAFGDLQKYWKEGMAMRQYYKAAALTGIMSNPALAKQIEAVSKLQQDDTFIVRMNCKLAGVYADYMLKEDEEAAL